MNWLQDLNRRLLDLLGLRAHAVLAIVVVAAGAGALLGTLFPKFEATALLQFPEPGAGGGVVTFPVFKRTAGTYATSAQLRAFVDAAGAAGSPAAARLLVQSEISGFWDRVATPVLPVNRRDQKELGDIRETANTALLGLDLVADARTRQLADEMIDVLARYFTNAVMRERIRSWVLAGRADAVGPAKGLQADIVRAELDIQLLEKRAQDMKEILKRYPDANKLDARQLVTVAPADDAERFLSPLAQLVGFESMISQRRETIRRLERELKQKRLLSDYYSEAERAVDATIVVDKLLPALQQAARSTFSRADASEEWFNEAALRVYGALDTFAAAPSQFGVRSGVRVMPVSTRSPVRLAILLGLLAAVALGGIALVRTSLRGARGARGLA